MAAVKPDHFVSTKEYEDYLIGVALTDRELADELMRRTKPQMFNDHFNRAVMVEGSRQWGNDGAFDGVRIAKAIKSKFPDVVYDLTVLADRNSWVTDAFFGIRIGELVKASQKRQLHSIGEHLTEMSMNGHDPSDIVRICKADFEDLEADQEQVIELRKASEIETRSIDWAWLNYLHRGGLTLVDGDPEKGKSQITCDMAARWTYPRPFPFMLGDNFRDPGNVLMINTEDGEGTTTCPRLEAAGANLDRVYFWPEDVDPPRLPNDVDRIAALAKVHDISLLIIDPLGAHLAEDINANRDADVRRALRPLVTLAQETNMAVMGVRHLNKDENKSALYRGGGSIAFTAAARVVWAVGADPNQTGRLVMAVLKSNIGVKPPALSYTIEGVGSTSRIKWEGESMLSIGDIFGRKQQQRGGKTCDAVSFLADLLAAGPMPAAEVEAACAEAGIKEWPFKQARKKLGIVSSKGSMREGWLMSLPEEGGFDEEGGNDAVHN